jgi:hypothetical protein
MAHHERFNLMAVMLKRLAFPALFNLTNAGRAKVSKEGLYELKNIFLQCSTLFGQGCFRQNDLHAI